MKISTAAAIIELLSGKDVTFIEYNIDRGSRFCFTVRLEGSKGYHDYDLSNIKNH